MSENAKVSAAHLRRRACVYVRQSTSAQVEHNRESTDRQYRLAERAVSLGWRRDQVTVIDDDLGVSGGGLVERAGFARLTSDVGLGHVGIVLGLEVSRLARNNADWYRLLDLCGVTDTLITIGLTAYFNHYAPRLRVIELYTQTPDTLAPFACARAPTTLLVDMANIETQWANREPQRNVHWLRDHAGLSEWGRSGAWTLYRVGSACH